MLTRSQKREVIMQGISDYSEGELSEDLIADSQISQNATSIEYQIPKTISLQINDVLKNNNAIKSINTVSKLCFPDDDLYDLEKVKNQIKLEQATQSIEANTVIIHVAHWKHFGEIISEYYKGKSLIFGLEDIRQIPKTEFRSRVTAFYKKFYLSSMKRDINVCLPPPENLNDIVKKSRKFGDRIVFHYVGLGFPKIEHDCVHIYHSKSYEFTTISVRDLYNLYSPPSLFIFDCVNAGSVLRAFENHVSEVLSKGNNSKMAIDENIYDNYVVVCATGENENLPIDPRLPKDLLTTSLFRPVSTSILFVILQNYNTSFPDNNFLLGYLENVLTSCDSSQGYKHLKSILDRIVDSIASDICSEEQFSNIFRKEPLLRDYFRYFSLYQYHLSYYGVHPCSKPSIPSFSTHKLWVRWISVVSQWIQSRLLKRPNFSHDIFSRAVSNFNILLKNNRKSIKNSHMLLVSGNINHESLMALSKYISKSVENTHKVSYLIDFGTLITELKNYKKYKDDALCCLCFIILNLLAINSSISRDLQEHSKCLVELLLHPNINDDIRSLVCAILCIANTHINLMTAHFTSDDKLNELASFISGTSKPVLLVWIFLFLKRYISYFPLFDMQKLSNIYIQLLLCITHKSYEVRASALSALSVFIEKNESTLTQQVMLTSFILICDGSYLVRYQLLVLASLFLKNHIASLTNSLTTKHLISASKSFESFLEHWIHVKPWDDIYAIAEQVDKVIERNDIVNHIFLAFLALLDVFSHDPHPTIRTYALKLRHYLRRTSDCNFRLKSERYDDIDRSEDEKTDDNSFSPVDIGSDALYGIILSQVVRNDSLINNSNSTSIPTPKYVNNCSSVSPKCLASISNGFESKPVRIVFNYETDNIVMLTEAKQLLIFDKDLTITNKISCKNLTITNLYSLYLNNVEIIITTAIDGCVYIWESDRQMPSLVFRSDPNFLHENVPLYALPFGTKLFTTRGKNSLVLWDLQSQTIINEFNRDTYITANLCEKDNNSVMVADCLGQISLFDMRQKEPVFITRPIKEPIISLSSNEYSTYAISSSNKCYAYNEKMDTFSIIKKFSGNFQIQPFSKSPYLVLYDDTSVRLADKDCNIVHSFNNIPQITNYAVHKSFPYVSFATQKSEMYIYSIF